MYLYPRIHAALSPAGLSMAVFISGPGAGSDMPPEGLVVIRIRSGSCDAGGPPVARWLEMGTRGPVAMLHIGL